MSLMLVFVISLSSEVSTKVDFLERASSDLIFESLCILIVRYSICRFFFLSFLFFEAK